jgi:hypothetical protein
VSALVPAPRRAAHALIRFYQLTLSSLIGRQCRYLPTCSAYADEAIRRHGLWAGSWMGLALPSARRLGLRSAAGAARPARFLGAPVALRSLAFAP